MYGGDKMLFLEMIFLTSPAEWNIKVHNLKWPLEKKGYTQCYPQKRAEN